ncbi:VPLPA-CTERM sorting domain-containing protein [Parvularcula maris]|uniref:VPLPA-CTERM sorting domain-containing protein n=1 Tax=Parvularcula maris TaxID=2965077 RepID=A0A9X2L906_9PROT|nr:VPLPA-CTERM sorting domain-containing protein [Parvularcula maris]MCQ8185139.1 VPLPA-CTERM sorting domain-containing protein [Parvularcula maris]
MRHLAAAAAALLASTGIASAANVTPDIIFGSDNANGSFTIDTEQTLELGLRAKLRYDDQGDPQNTFNYDGVDTYTFVQTAGTPSNRSVFNFEWSINSDTADGSDTLDSYVYLLAVDFDPGAGTNFVFYDPVRTFGTNAWYGDNDTANGGGTVANAGGSEINDFNVAQNSVNYGFIPNAPLGDGIYSIILSAFAPGDLDNPVATTSINVVVGEEVPLPAAFPFMLGGLAGFAALRRRAGR